MSWYQLQCCQCDADSSSRETLKKHKDNGHQPSRCFNSPSVPPSCASYLQLPPLHCSTSNVILRRRKILKNLNTTTCQCNFSMWNFPLCWAICSWSPNSTYLHLDFYSSTYNIWISIYQHTSTKDIAGQSATGDIAGGISKNRFRAITFDWSDLRT